jgi:hypothetical protein
MTHHQANQLRKRVGDYSFVDEVEEIPRVSSPTTRSTARRPPVPALPTQPVEHSTQEIHEDQVQPEDKDQVIKELQEQLKEAKHVIAQYFQYNRELKRKLVEKTPDMQTSEDALGPRRQSVPKVPEVLKGKEVKQSPKVVDLTKPTSPMTRSSAKRMSLDLKLAEIIPEKGQPVEKTHTSPGEGEKTVKWLNKQLREAQDLIIRLKRE